MFSFTAQITPDLVHVESKKIWKGQTMMTRIASSIPIWIFPYSAMFQFQPIVLKAYREQFAYQSRTPTYNWDYFSAYTLTREEKINKNMPLMPRPDDSTNFGKWPEQIMRCGPPAAPPIHLPWCLEVTFATTHCMPYTLSCCSWWWLWW